MPVVLSLTSFFSFSFGSKHFIQWVGEAWRGSRCPPSGQILGVYQSLRASLTSFNTLLGRNSHLSGESGLNCLYTASLEKLSVGLSRTGLGAAFPTEGLQGPFLVQGKSTVVCFCAVLVIGFSPLTLLIYLGYIMISGVCPSLVEEAY